jgi:hypothetical protein
MVPDLIRVHLCPSVAELLLAQMMATATNIFFGWLVGGLFGLACCAPPVLLVIVMVMQIGKSHHPPQDRDRHGFSVLPPKEPHEKMPPE